MKKHTIVWEKLSVLLFIMLVLFAFSGKQVKAGSDYVQNVSLSAQNACTVDVSFDYTLDPDQRRNQSVEFYLYNAAKKEIDSKVIPFKDGEDPRGNYRAIFGNLDINTQYYVKIICRHTTFTVVGGISTKEESDELSIKTPSLDTPVIGLELKGYNAESAILQAIMVYSGTGDHNENLSLPQTVQCLFKSINHSGIAIVKKSDYNSNSGVLTGFNANYHEKIIAFVDYLRWNTNVQRNVFLSPQTLELEENTTYVVQAYLQNKDGVLVGSPIIEFTTYKKPSLTVTGDLPHSNSAYVFADIKLDARDTLKGLGAVTSTSIVDPSNVDSAIEGTLSSYNSSTGTARFYFEGLLPDKEYRVQVFSQTLAGKVYSKSYIFKTLPAPVLATVTSNPATFIRADGAKLTGTVTNSGNTGIIEHGFIYSSNDPMPSIGKSGVTKQIVTITSQQTPVVFSGFLNGLKADTRYFYRAYVINTKGTSYSEVKVVDTLEGPSIETRDIEEVAINYAKLTGNIVSTGGVAPTVRGILISDSVTVPALGSENIVTLFNTEVTATSGLFTMTATQLASNTTYYYRAFMNNRKGTFYGEVKALTTANADIYMPNTTSLSAESTLDTSLVARGAATTPKGATMTEMGVVWSTFPNPVIGQPNVTKVVASGSSPFGVQVSGLSANSNYYYRAYATNRNGTTYGANISVKTTNTIGTPGKAYVGDTVVSSVTVNKAQVSINVPVSGTPLFTRKILYSSVNEFPTLTGSNVTAINAGVVAATSAGTTNTIISGLQPDTTYYVRGYTSNTAGESYGGVVMFTTASPGLPIIQNSSGIPTEKTSTSIRAGALVNGDGLSVTQYGFVYSDSNHFPTLGDQDSTTKTFNSNAQEFVFSETLSGLQPGTTYFCTMFASSTAGVSYGDFFEFTTSEAAPPSIGIIGMDKLHSTGATATIELKNANGQTISRLGVAVSQNALPAIENNDTITKETYETGTGVFQIDITGLLSSAKYYARTYAVTFDGSIFYSNSIFFTTELPVLPLVYTKSISDRTTGSAKITGEVIHGGEGTVASQGVVYGTVSEPIMTDTVNFTSLKATLTGEGEYSINITNLSPSTFYYVRTYAISEFGIGYGETKVFSTVEVVIPSGTPSPSASPGVSMTPTPVPSIAPSSSPIPSISPAVSAMPSSSPSPTSTTASSQVSSSPAPSEEVITTTPDEQPSESETPVQVFEQETKEPADRAYLFVIAGIILVAAAIGSIIVINKRKKKKN